MPDRKQKGKGKSWHQFQKQVIDACFIRPKQIPPKALRVTLSKGRLGGGDLNSDAWELLDFRAEAKHLDEYSVLIQMCLTDGRKGIRRFAFVISYKARGDL